MNCGVMLNAYPDSLGGTLSDIACLLERSEMKDAFRSFYILPSVFNTDLDRGFSVISYDLNRELTAPNDLKRLRAMGMDLKLDFILNHISVQSPQFQDILKYGEKSAYRDFFIDWNAFWAGKGQMMESGYIQPEEEYIRDMFFRKPGLPILMVRYPDGKDVPYWNTFYQQVWEEGGERKYLGQMDLNVQSDLVWQYYDEILSKLASYGASIVRLDAFGYASKIPGRKNFMNDPETWEILERIRQMAECRGLILLPEIHDAYAAGSYRTLAEKGYMTYDFFLPGLLIDALEHHDGHYLQQWAQEQKNNNIRCVNMLGCHDGIPLLDLKGLMPDERIQSLIDLVISRGGMVKNLHGKKNMYYQVNATYFSALGADERKMLLSRALQLFMPGKPQVWYLDLFVGENDYDAVQKGGEAGHKEINRTNLTKQEIEQRLQWPVVQNQIKLLQMRNLCKAFDFDSEMRIDLPEEHTIRIEWCKDGATARLIADLQTYQFTIVADITGKSFCFEQSTIFQD